MNFVNIQEPKNWKFSILTELAEVMKYSKYWHIFDIGFNCHLMIKDIEYALS